MRKNLLILAFAAMAMASQADVLTPEQALGRAMGSGPAKAASIDGAPKLVFTDVFDGQPVTYVFEKAKGGYMLLSADDAAAPVLGYSDEGTFDENNIPDNMRYWLDMYADEIAYARANGIAYEAPARATNWTAIAPLCTTKWNQDAPYNDMCPVAFENGQHAVTGCVATAMAQLMKYHNYPDVGEGQKSNTSPGFPVTTINFANVKFDWANMTDTYNSKSTDVQRHAVAELMVACGVSVDMSYTTNMSGAVSAVVAQALVKYFKYDEACRFLYRDYYSMTEWKEMAYNELKTVGPVLYAGTSNEGGHCFIVDGFDGQDYFHLNWGWGGMSDGYFLLSALNPSSQGIGGYSPGAGFTKNQGMLLGAKKPVAGSKKFYQLTLNENPFKIAQAASTLGGQITLSNSAYNYSSWQATGTIGIFLTAANGSRQFVGHTPIDVRGISGNSIYGTGPYAVRLPASLAPGTYTVTPAWKSNDGTEYPIYVKINLCRSYTMTVSGNNVTFKANDEAPQLQATKLQVVSKKLYAGQPAQFRVTFTNTSKNEYYGDVAAGLYTSTPTSGVKPAYVGSAFIVDVAPGETVEMPYDVQFKTAPAGKYKLAFYNPNKNYELLGSAFDVTFEATPTDAETKYTVSDFGFIDGITQNVNPNNLAVKFSIDCTAGYFHKDLNVIITRSNNNNVKMATLTVPDFALYAGESKAVEVYGAANLSYSSRYTYNLYLVDGIVYAADKVLAGPINFSVPNTSGIDDVTGDEAVEVRYYNLQGMPVDIEQAAPGVYVRVSVYADGTSSTEKISK